MHFDSEHWTFFLSWIYDYKSFLSCSKLSELKGYQQVALSAIYLFNWFYSFSLNRLSLICFCNWKNKKTKTKTNQTWPETRLTRPARFATSTGTYTQRMTIKSRMRSCKVNILKLCHLTLNTNMEQIIHIKKI